MEKQIQVQPNSALPLISTLFQRMLIALFAYFGLAMSHDDTVKLASLLATLALTGWGAFRSWQSNEAKKRMERHVSNEVATLKR